MTAFFILFFSLVFMIIKNMNMCQDAEWQSFPLFKLGAAIAGYLYVPKINRTNNCMTYLTISGEGFSTGKSLMEDVCMFTLYGKKIECSIPASVSKLYDKLSEGKPIYGIYFLTIDATDNMGWWVVFL